MIFQGLRLFVSDDFMLSADFANSNFFRKMVLLGMWGRFTLYKYISCWLLAEGGCILFGKYLFVSDYLETVFLYIIYQIKYIPW